MRHTKADNLMCRNLYNILAFKNYIALLRRKQSGDGMQCRRLSGSVRTDQRDRLSLIDLKGNPLDRLNHSIIYVQIFYFKHCHCDFLLTLPDML